MLGLLWLLFVEGTKPEVVWVDWTGTRGPLSGLAGSRRPLRENGSAQLVGAELAGGARLCLRTTST